MNAVWTASAQPATFRPALH